MVIQATQEGNYFLEHSFLPFDTFDPNMNEDDAILSLNIVSNVVCFELESRVQVAGDRRFVSKAIFCLGNSPPAIRKRKRAREKKKRRERGKPAIESAIDKADQFDTGRPDTACLSEIRRQTRLFQ